MKSILIQTMLIYTLATGISLAVAALIKAIDRALRPASQASPTKGPR